LGFRTNYFLGVVLYLVQLDDQVEAHDSLDGLEVDLLLVVLLELLVVDLFLVVVLLVVVLFLVDHLFLEPYSDFSVPLTLV